MKPISHNDFEGPLKALSLQLLFERDTLQLMKVDIHPEYTECNVTCTCGNAFVTRSTKSEIHVEICSACHPLYTGKQKLVDTGGRVERFRRRVAKSKVAEKNQQR